VLVETVTPAALAAMGPPIVRPPRIRLSTDPAGIPELPTVRTTAFAPVAPLLPITAAGTMEGVTPDARKPLG